MATKSPMKKRKYRGGFLAKLLTVLAAVAAVVIGVMIFFKVQTVSVLGNGRYTAAEIIEASGIATGENLMTLNKPAAAQNIKTRLPYVEEVRIARQLPDTVLIEVTESEAVAIVCDETGGQWLLNSSAKIVEQVTESTLPSFLEGLIEVTGAYADTPVVGQSVTLQQEEQSAALKQLLQSLSQTALLGGVRSVDLERTYELKLYYEDRFEVQLGGTDQLDYKIRYLEEIVLNQLEPTKTGTIDLTLEEEGVARLIPW